MAWNPNPPRERERGCQFIMSAALWRPYMCPAMYRFYGLLMKAANAQHLYVSYSAQSECLVTRHARTHVYKSHKIIYIFRCRRARAHTQTHTHKLILVCCQFGSHFIPVPKNAHSRHYSIRHGRHDEYHFFES